MGINSKSTKAEILAAYKEIEKQKKVLEIELKSKPKNIAAVSQSIPQLTVQKTALTTNKNDNQDIAQTIISLAKIKNGFGGAVSNLSEQLIKEASELVGVRQDITAESLELKELYQLEKIAESTIDSLIEHYQENAKKFAEKFSQQQENDLQEIETLNQAWTKEKESYNRTIKTRNEEYRKTQQREKDEYEYNLDLARDLDEEKYYQEQKLKQEELESHRQNLEQQWQEKEQGIVKLEQEYATAKEKVTAFAEQLQTKIKQAQEEGKGIGTYQAKVKADLRSREIEGETKNYELRIESLEQTIQDQGNRISKLSKQLDASLQQVQDLAVKAIEGSSNRNSFEAMKAIAMEQAKTQTKGK